MTKSKSSKKTEVTEVSEPEVVISDETLEDEAKDETPQQDTPSDVNPLETADDTLATDAEPEDTSPYLQAEPEQKVIVQKTGFFATLTAGVLAAGAGFLGAQYSSQSWPFEPGPSIDPLAVAQSAQDDVGALEDRMTAAEDAIANQANAAPDLSGLEAELADITATLADVETRLATLEERPAATGMRQAVDMSEVEGEISTLQEQIASLIAEANFAEASAAAAAQTELARAALARMMANLETGAPFADALADMKSASDIAIPSVLSDVAADGVPTLLDLQDSFDPVARDALAAARGAASNEDAGVADRLGAFFRARTGARSVEPREGDDADAVLSRVGASIDTGNLGDALAEAEALPEEARSVMTEWLSQAQTRQQALAAADALLQELNSN
ncbi:MAG: hypothetical protein AAGK92_01395 [Pseudomonadota bacterium]